MVSKHNCIKQEPDYDVCVVCGAATPYTVDTHIDEREYYIEGLGQLCNYCAYTCPLKSAESQRV